MSAVAPRIIAKESADENRGDFAGRMMDAAGVDEGRGRFRLVGTRASADAQQTVLRLQATQQSTEECRLATRVCIRAPDSRHIVAEFLGGTLGICSRG